MKFLLTIATLFLFVTMGTAQSAKLQDKAMKKVEKLDTKLTTANADAALSDAQKEQIKALYVKQLQETKTIKKSDATEEAKKEQMKELRKSVTKEINKEILTKAQKSAKKSSKE